MKKQVWKHSFESVFNFVKNNGNGTVLLSKEYVNTNSIMSFKCRCGEEFKTTFSKFKHRNKTQCNKCSGVKRWNYERVKELFISKNLTPLFTESDRISASQKLQAINTEGYKVVTTPDKLNQGRTPRPFSKYNPHTIENLHLYASRNARDYKLLSTTYKNNLSKLEWQCPERHLFLMNWADFQSDRRCPFCSESKGERRVREWLVDNSITYRKEKTFEDLIGENKQPLRYDFGIYENNSLIGLIEYDGELHFETPRFSRDKDKNELKLKRTQYYDKMKDTYAKDNNIKLLRIPYWEYDNIEEILTTKFNSGFFNG